MGEARKSKPWPEILGERVRQRRVELGWRQIDLATRIQRHETYVRTIEHGRTNVSVQVLLELSLALGVDPHVLVSGLGPLSPGDRPFSGEEPSPTSPPAAGAAGR